MTGRDDCVKCKKCGSVRTDMSVRDSLKAIGLIYGFPFLCFLGGMAAGMMWFAGTSAKYLLSFGLGAALTAAYYLALGRAMKGR
ncbi:MAG: hypothetical protein ABH885_01005 [Candidatus Omnitrophota bacterium]